MLFLVVIINKTASKRSRSGFLSAKELKRIILIDGSTQISGNGGYCPIYSGLL